MLSFGALGILMHKASHPCGFPGCPETTYTRYCEAHKDKALGHPCRHPGCPEITVERYCPTHTYQAQPDNRPSSTARGYGYQHQQLRTQVLQEEPYCRLCGRPSGHMDHIDGNVKNNNRDNLQGLCASCHSKKTIQCNHGWGHYSTAMMSDGERRG